MAWSGLHNTQALALRIAKGDADAFRELYLSTNKRLFTAVMAYAKQVESAQDILQQAYLKLWETRERLTEVKDLEAYLATIARNLALNHLEKLASQRRTIAGFQAQAAAFDNKLEKNIEDRQALEKYADAVNRLSPQRKQAYLLSLDENLSLAEIAEKMDISSNTVKRHLTMARRFVRAYLSDMQIILFIMATLVK